MKIVNCFLICFDALRVFFEYRKRKKTLFYTYIFLFQIQAFNLAGASPFSNITKEFTAQLPPVTSAEVSEDQVIKQDEKAKEDPEKENIEIIKYLIVGGCLAGSLIVIVILCTAHTFYQRRKSSAMQKSCAANGHAMTEIQDKYNDTAVQISNHQSFSNLDSSRILRSNQSFYSTKDNLHFDGSGSHFEMTLLPDPHQQQLPVVAKNLPQQMIKNNSISDSMFSSGHNSAELNSLGHEEYNDEPSRSWRRSRRSEEGFI